MARAAVKAKQAQQAQAQAATKPSRKQRKHASGGNPNQDLFFTRLRRRQRWVFLGLAILFAISFAALGVGSGGSGGLSGIYSGIFGSSNDPVSKAQAEIKAAKTIDASVKGYTALANAYIAKGDIFAAISTLKTGIGIKKSDYRLLSQLAAVEKQEADAYALQYQQLQQNAQVLSPGTIVQPSGAFAGQLGTNPIDQYYSQQNSVQSTQAYTNAVNDYKDSLSSYQSAAKYAPRSSRGSAEIAVANAARLTGNKPAELHALQKYVEFYPHAPGLSGIEKTCKSLGGTCAPKSHKK